MQTPAIPDFTFLWGHTLRGVYRSSHPIYVPLARHCTFVRKFQSSRPHLPDLQKPRPLQVSLGPFGNAQSNWYAIKAMQVTGGTPAKAVRNHKSVFVTQKLRIAFCFFYIGLACCTDETTCPRSLRHDSPTRPVNNLRVSLGEYMMTFYKHLGGDQHRQ